MIRTRPLAGSPWLVALLAGVGAAALAAPVSAQHAPRDIQPVAAGSAVVAPPDGSPPPLHVRGADLLDDADRPVRLKGVNIASLEWSNDGEHLAESLDAAVGDWRAKVIRLPLSQDRWFGAADAQSDGGAAYRAIVEDFVQSAAGRGVYVVLDLHWSDAGRWGENLSQHDMPDANSRTFWTDVARRYAGHPAVLFDLFNEPRKVSWDVWRDGGPVSEEAGDGHGPLEYRGVGMQQLLDAVRAEGADNVVIAGGLDWAYDLTGVLDGHALTDAPGGRGVVYSAHIYPWKSDWEGKVGRAADVYPVFVGEVGCEVDGKHEDPYTWGPRMLAWLDHRNLHYAAWCFHPGASPRMLQDWTFAPTPYWGALVKADLLGGAHFTSDAPDASDADVAKPADRRIRVGPAETKPVYATEK